MKIKEFSELFDINKSTVRFYCDNHLILPRRISNYNDFDEICVKDMRDCLALKEMGFSIEEIQTIKSYERLMIRFGDEENRAIKELFNKKSQQLLTEIDNIRKKLGMISDYTSKLEKSDQKHIGVGLKMLDFIRCPQCKGKPTIKDATIEDGQIISAIIHCTCDNTFSIKNGMLICDDNITPDSMLLKEEQFLLQNPLERVRPSHININLNMGREIYGELNTMDHSKGVLFLYSDCDLLMMRLDSYFRESGCYIFTCPNYRCLKILKDKLESIEAKGQFLFIYSTKEIPVEGAKYIVDNSSNIVEYLMEFPIGTTVNIVENLRDCGEVLYEFRLMLKSGSNTLKNHPLLVPAASKSMIFDSNRYRGYEIVSSVYIGSISNIESITTVYSEGDELEVYLYKLKKGADL